MAAFLQTLESVIAIGSLYALIALGYTMVYGILKFINFAHSDVVVLGAWLSYKLSVNLLPLLGIDAYGQPPWWSAGLVLVLSMLCCGAVGFGIERLCYRPLRRSPRLNVLITAIGVSLFLQNFGQLNAVFGKTPRPRSNLISSEPLIQFSAGPAPDGTVKIDVVDVVTFVTAGVLVLLLEFLVYRTKLGTAMRTVSFSTETAPLMGINVDNVISTTFVIGSMLAAAAGFLTAMRYHTLQQPAHVAWVLLGLKAFVAAVVGGIGNLRGAVVGAFLIAGIEQFGAQYVSTNLKDFFVFALLILMLLVKPTGLLGSPVREKV